MLEAGEPAALGWWPPWHARAAARQTDAHALASLTVPAPPRGAASAELSPQARLRPTCSWAGGRGSLRLPSQQGVQHTQRRGPALASPPILAALLLLRLFQSVTPARRPVQPVPGCRHGPPAHPRSIPSASPQHPLSAGDLRELLLRKF